MAIKKQHWPAKQNLQLLDFFLLIMPFTFLFNTFDVNGTGSFAIFGQKCHKKLNRLTGHSGRAISVNFTPHFIFLPFWAKYFTKNCASRRYTQIMSGQGHNMVILLFLCVYKLDRHPFHPSMILCLFLLKMQQESYICGCFCCVLVCLCLCFVFCKTLRFNMCLCLRSSNFVH